MLHSCRHPGHISGQPFRYNDGEHCALPKPQIQPGRKHGARWTLHLPVRHCCGLWQQWFSRFYLLLAATYWQPWRAAANQADEGLSRKSPSEENKTRFVEQSANRNLANSSQLDSGYKINTYIGGWPNGTAKSSQLARNHTMIVWQQDHMSLTGTVQSPNDNKTTWQFLPCLAEVAKQWKTWLKLGTNLSFIKLKPTWLQLEPTQANWVAKQYPTPPKLAWDGRRTIWACLEPWDKHHCSTN